LLDRETSRLSYVNAGHNPPLAVTPQGCTRLEATGLPLGLFDGSTYTAGEAEVPPGSVVVFFTDGLVEREDPRQEPYGEERLLAAVRSAAGRPASGIVDAIVRDLERFARGASAADDTALLVVRPV